MVLEERKLCYECKHCHNRESLRKGTVMENSKLPFLYWFTAMHLLTATKNTFSAYELQRQLGHKRYQPIWEMLHKLRSVMGGNTHLLEMWKLTKVSLVQKSLMNKKMRK